MFASPRIGERKPCDKSEPRNHAPECLSRGFGYQNQGWLNILDQRYIGTPSAMAAVGRQSRIPLRTLGAHFKAEMPIVDVSETSAPEGDTSLQGAIRHGHLRAFHELSLGRPISAES